MDLEELLERKFGLRQVIIAYASIDSVQSAQQGHLCLHFYDIEGEEIKGPLRSRVFGLEAEHIKKIPTTIGMVYERGEHSAILGALRGHWINVLITDQFTAQSLVMT